MRTIAGNSQRFTCVTTFGHRIATACDDGRVGIYDSVTGVLKQNLSPIDPVHAMRGSPDGSIPFCAHRVSSITAWDMQTGELIHTFGLEWNKEDIAVSLKGRYLACGLSDGSVHVWEAANKIGEFVTAIGSPVTYFCWLEPEERLAVSTGVTIDVRDIVAGTVLQRFTVRHPANQMAYSQKLDRLVIMTSLTRRDTITVINLQKHTSIVYPSTIPKNLSCFTLSQTTEELVCGMETNGLQLFDISTGSWTEITHPDTMTHTSSLPDGTVVANFVASGIQLLSLDGERFLSRGQDIHALTVRALDQGKIIAILLISRDQIALLETTTMSQILAIPPQQTPPVSADRTHILCASLENHIVVYWFEVGDRKYMQSCKLRAGGPRWTVEIDGLPSIGAISSSGAQLVTFHDAHNQTCIYLWDIRYGKLKAELRTGPVHPLDITFDSETRFYSRQDTSLVLYDVTSSLHDRTFTIVPSSVPATLSHSITRSGPLSLTRGTRKKHYDLDSTHEWVVNGSKRICWIPPGYIGSAQPSYWWAGHSLVMIGQDGKLRKLTFKEPF